MRKFSKKNNQMQAGESLRCGRRAKPTSKPSNAAHPLLKLQRTIGNRSVQRMLNLQKQNTDVPLSPSAAACSATGALPGFESGIVRTGNGNGPEHGEGAPPGQVRPTASPPLDFGQACTAREEIPKDHSGAQGLQGLVHDYFKMEADWNDTGPTCRCTCGEYRQYVKGRVIVNNRRVRKRLYAGAYLEQNTYHEDADDQGRPYGHRTGYQNTNIDKFIEPGQTVSDRETACSYRGIDTPGIEAPSGSHLDMHLWFKGQTYDRCRRRFGPAHEWETIWDGPIP